VQGETVAHTLSFFLFSPTQNIEANILSDQDKKFLLSFLGARWCRAEGSSSSSTCLFESVGFETCLPPAAATCFYIDFARRGVGSLIYKAKNVGERTIGRLQSYM
jgi:hypothetical protein